MKTLRIFVSSPGDVVQERALTQRIIESLQGRFMGYVKLAPVFWEHEPLLASSTFQDQIIMPSQTDIVVCILWSRLGTRLPPNITRADGSHYASGTEFEFEDAINAFEKNGSPALLVYHKTKQAVISLNDKAALLEKMQQKESLDEFIQKWFINADGSIKSAFHTYEEIEDFEGKIEQHLQLLIERKIKQLGLTGEPSGFDDTTRIGCPYQGLEAFEAEHQKLFFGRTQEIHEIIDALRKQAADNRAFLLILGASGSGKSSLVRAGVIPMLIRPGVVEQVLEWRQAVVRPSDSEHNACHALLKGLTQARALPELADVYPDLNELAVNVHLNPDVLNVAIRQILGKSIDKQINAGTTTATKSDQPPQARLLLLLDQFEELFTNDDIDTEQRQQFITLVDALARGGMVWVMSTLRSDFYSRYSEFDMLSRLKEGHGQYDLLPPKAPQIGQMIRQPALFGGLIFEHDPVTGVRLDEVLLDSAGNNPSALPLLSFTLEALYHQRTANGKLTFAAYRAFGGLEGALAKKAEDTFNQLNEAVQHTLPQLMAHLVQVGTRRKDIASRKRCIYDPGQWPQESQKLVEAFIAARLFVSETSVQGHTMISVAHEALIEFWPRLAAWVEENRDSLQLQQRIASGTKEWLHGDKDQSFLFTGNRLSEVTRWFGKYANHLNEKESEFVQCSITQRNQKRQAKKERQARELKQAQDSARRILETTTLN